MRRETDRKIESDKKREKRKEGVIWDRQKDRHGQNERETQRRYYMGEVQNKKKGNRF